MDLETFYQEQDRHMNSPEEDFKDYLRRMNVTSVSSTGRGAVISGSEARGTPSFKNHPRCPRVAEQQIKDVQAELSDQHEIHETKSLHNDAMALNASRRTGPFVSPTAALSPSKDEPVVPEVLDQWENPGSCELSPSTTSPGHLLSPRLADVSTNNPDRLDVEVADEHHRSIPLKCDAELIELDRSASTSRSRRSQSILTPLKRKASSEVDIAVHIRKRSNEQVLPEETSSPIEEITSLSTCPRPDRKSVERRPITKPLPKGKASLKQRKIPALDLRPVFTSARPKATNEGDTSPIEEYTVAGSRSKSPVKNPKGVSSLMLLDVKERVTKRLAERSKQDRSSGSKSMLKDHSTVICVSSSSSRSSSPDVEFIGSSSNLNVPKKELVTGKAQKKKTQKEKAVLLTPKEFATSLIATTTPREGGGLEGTVIYYTGGDMQFASERTRRRMNLILRHGGHLAPNYDAVSVTHIVTDAQKRPTLRALGLKGLNGIPQHIPTVTWDWVASRMNKKPDLNACYDRLFMTTAFPERIEAGFRLDPKGKGKQIADDDISHIFDFTHASVRPSNKKRGSSPMIRDSESEDEVQPALGNILPSPPSSPLHRIKSLHGPLKDVSIIKAESEQDPLAEFYEQARSQSDSKWCLAGDSDAEASSGMEMDLEEVPAPSRSNPSGSTSKPWKWTCDGQSPEKGPCPNQDIIDKLEELKQLHHAKVGDDDQWRVFSYNKCIRALRGHPKRISTFDEARTIRGVGDKTAAKIMEILQTGDLRRITYENTADVQTTKLFQGIYGVGRATAYQWYAAGCRTIEDLTGGSYGIQLTPAQEIGIQFYEDINDRMPRQETKQLFDLIKPIALKIDPELFIQVMGSYRRGKATCGDIDILISRDPSDGKTHEGVLPRLLGDLHAAGILTEDLALPENDKDLENVYRGLCRLPNIAGSRRRRIDFLTVPWQSRGAALLYYTGDDIFNRAMRMKANKMGYSLNQRGLFSNVVRDPRDRRIKLNKGTMVASETEEEIFKILQVPWQEPHERVRG